MDGEHFGRKLFLFLFLCNVYSGCTTTEVCSNSVIPGAKGDPGEVGAEGEEGRMGKTGPPGLQGLTGEGGERGDMGQMGKMGPIGNRGDKGQQGMNGAPGMKGKLEPVWEPKSEKGTTCDCGRYRKVVGQMDVNISKLKNAVKFLKNVILGIRETEDKFYLLVKEQRKYAEARLNCKLRGGSLAMPRTAESNTLLAKYISEADVTHVFIGLQVGEPEVGYMYVDGESFLNITSWGLQAPHRDKGNCVQMSNSGAWSQVECGATQYYICEFAKTRKTPATVT